MPSPARVEPGEVHYAKSDGVNVAFQVTGDGPADLVFVPGWISHIDAAWEDPGMRRFLEPLASFSRLIQFDKRGTGLSDRVPDTNLPTMEERMDDVRAVMDAAESERAALLGFSEGGTLAALFAATYPERVENLVLWGSYASAVQRPGYPWGMTPELAEEAARAFEGRWGTGVGLRAFAPALAHDRAARAEWGRFQRLSASPGAAIALLRMNIELDIRGVLPSIRVPTLVLHRRGDRLCPVEGGRYLAEAIDSARYVELDGDGHWPWVGDLDPVVEEIEEFITGERGSQEPDRMLATVLFTDIVASTERAAALGDRRWRELLERHDALVRRQLERHRGREVKTVGDGFLATFDGPARAIRCASAIRDAARGLDLEVRAGLHTGECELIGDDIGGLCVNIAARIAALADAGEVLVSRTVTDLVAGSSIPFADRGRRTLKGVPGEWELYVADGA